MLSVNDLELTVKKALELGAKGYLSKRCSLDELPAQLEPFMPAGFI